MIGIDASVCIKWFKSGERYDAEAQVLRQRLARQEVEAVASEILSLEIVRGLKKAQVQQPALGITDTDIEDAFSLVEGMFQTGILLECPVTDVKARAKEIEVRLACSWRTPFICQQQLTWEPAISSRTIITSERRLWWPMQPARVSRL